MKKVIRSLLKFFTVMAILLALFLLWMRGGEEESLDYSALSYAPSAVGADENGFAAMVEFCEDHQAVFPDDYESDCDYVLRKNWGQKLFEKILAENEVRRRHRSLLEC